MRFMIERVKLDVIHPIWPGETVYKIYDRNVGQYRYGCYTTMDAAERGLKKIKKRLLGI